MFIYRHKQCAFPSNTQTIEDIYWASTVGDNSSDLLWHQWLEIRPAHHQGVILPCRSTSAIFSGWLHLFRLFSRMSAGLWCELCLSLKRWIFFEVHLWQIYFDVQGHCPAALRNFPWVPLMFRHPDVILLDTMINLGIYFPLDDSCPVLKTTKHPQTVVHLNHSAYTH